MCAGRLSVSRGTMVCHLSATSSTVRLCGRILILVGPSWPVFGTGGIGDCVKDGSPIIPISLVSPSSPLAPDPWTDVENFLEEVTLYRPTVGDFCPKNCDFVGRLASLLVSQSNDIVVQILDTLFNGTDQKLFGRVQQSKKRQEVNDSRVGHHVG